MCKPSIIMIGLPNSGTSILAKLYQTMGWHFEPDHEMSMKFMHVGWLARPATAWPFKDKAAEVSACNELRNGFRKAAKPVIAKHHNLSWSLSAFTDIILENEPGTMLVLVEKEINLIKRSTRLRRSDGSGFLHRPIDEWTKAARNQYRVWPGAKHTIRYESIRDAVAARNVEAFRRELGVLQYKLYHVTVLEAMDLFDPTRDEDGNPHRGHDGWWYPKCG